MMSREVSREERIISKLEFIEYVCENYPHVLTEWKNKVGAEPITAQSQDDAVISLRNQPRGDHYEDK